MTAPTASASARYRDERGKERARHFERRIDAQRWLDEVTSTIHDGTWGEPRAGNVTFADFYAEWAPRQLWLPSTRANADLTVGSVPFGDLPFKAIRRSHIEAWVKEASEKWAPTTVKVKFVIVRSVFRAALADRVIEADPCLGAALPRRRKAEAAMQVPTVEEVGRLLWHADSNRVSTRKGFRAYVALCAFAGLRKGEAAAVQVGDIDFLRPTLNVSRQLQRHGSTYAARLPKYGSERVVCLPDELVTILSEHIATHLPNAEPEAWLFTVGDEPMYDNDITWRWRATGDSAKLPTVRLHD
ncbi:tyrosine-type recombinase/integrase, partial [Nocardioides sp.]|uniref:tyrosine-type recombinase/integrase n=1 Tax=Nocardioides sp. TaxID=35761 RepID=UPI0039E5996A